MAEAPATSQRSEAQFADWVETLAADPDRRERLSELLREDHPDYDQRGAAAIVRMRGWVLLALARDGLSESALLFVLEELDTGLDPYLVAAAARALRSYRSPQAAFAPFVTRALANIRYRDEAVSFERYGDYPVSAAGTTPVHELLATLAWLGPQARAVRGEVELLRTAPGGLRGRSVEALDRALEAIDAEGPVDEMGLEECCKPAGGPGLALFGGRGVRRRSEAIEGIVFEDHEGAAITFGELFRGHPSIVAFFYTRCDNPLKCSLTVTKLARVRELLEARGLAGRIHTAAITYDPAFDLPDRLRRYGRDRGMVLDARHRMLRATGGLPALRDHFRLGVNFVGSLVNRHRIELFILDAEARIAASFERLHWDERQVADEATALLEEEREETPRVPPRAPEPRAARGTASLLLGILGSLGVAFFPKCPICWAGYLSMLGVAGFERIPYSPWLLPLLAGTMLINLVSVWLRSRSTRRLSPFCLVGLGALAILLSRLVTGWEGAAVWGVALTISGSLLSALRARGGRAERPALSGAPARSPAPGG